MSRLLAIALLALAPTAAGATSITYEIFPLGGARHRAEYSVTHDAAPGAAALAWFQIDFDPVLYVETTLLIATPPALAAEFDELLLGSGIGLPAAYDAFAIGPGIAAGETRDGFAVEFDWLGTGAPGAQAFRVLDPGTLGQLETGLTASLPEPGTGLFLMVGLSGLAGWRLRRARITNPLAAPARISP